MLSLGLHLSTLINYYGGDNREEEVVVEPDPDEEEIKYVVLDDESELHCRFFFEKKNVGVDGKKSLLHAKKWDV